jgi:hypothetical protein
MRSIGHNSRTSQDPPRNRQARLDENERELNPERPQATQSHWGDKLEDNGDSKYFRVLFHNVNGISRSNTQGPDRQREILEGVRNKKYKLPCSVSWNVM